MTKASFTLSGLQIYAEDGIHVDANLVIENGRIQKITSEKISAKNPLNFPSNYHLIPGLIDLHIHGVKGNDVMDANQQALTAISMALAEEGTTGFLATTMTSSQEKIENALREIKNFMQQAEKVKGANLLGIHLEGPFISPQKIGAQCADYVSSPNIETFKNWQTLADNHIKLVTLAPEEIGSLELIRYLKKNNMIAAMGHTNATYDEALLAIENGCIYVTHLFNAMRGIHQREPGVVTAALLDEKISTELIVDGVHLHPAIVELALKIKGKEKIILVTDAMRATCLGDGCYDLGGQTVTVKNNKATLSDGTLAGSVLKMPSAIKNMMQFTGCTLFDAIKMASENPAKMIGVFDRKGSIAPNKDADLVVLDDKLNVVLTVCGGEIVYTLPSRSVPPPIKLCH